MNSRSSNRLIVTAIIVYAAIQMILTISIVTLQVDAIKSRAESRAQRTVIKNQNDALICILRTQPSERTESAINICKNKFGVK